MDAANYGRGLGDSLGRLLLQVPQIRAQMAQQQRQEAFQQQEQPLQLDLLRAQTERARAESGMMPIRLRQEQAQTGMYEAEADRNRAMATAEQQKQTGQDADLELGKQILSKVVMGKQLSEDEANLAGGLVVKYPHIANLISKTTTTAKNPNVLNAAQVANMIAGIMGKMGDETDVNNAFSVLDKHFPGAVPGGGSQTNSIAQPRTQTEYDALPSGTVYIDTDGATKRKK